MSYVDPVDRLGWLTAILALEDAGHPVTFVTVARHLRARRPHVRRQMAKLRDDGVVAGVERIRLSAVGRWYMGRPVLIYVAAPFDTLTPAACARDQIIAAGQLALSVGPPAGALMPSVETLAAAAGGSVAALAVCSAVAVRADVVAVVGHDPLLEGRADVVAAERADVMVLLAPEHPGVVISEALRSGVRRP